MKREKPEQDEYLGNQTKLDIQFYQHFFMFYIHQGNSSKTVIKN